MAKGQPPTIRATPEFQEWINGIQARLLAANVRVSHKEILDCMRELVSVDKVIECLTRPDSAGKGSE